jgi:hypothetical protein
MHEHLFSRNGESRIGNLMDEAALNPFLSMTDQSELVTFE